VRWGHGVSDRWPATLVSVSSGTGRAARVGVSGALPGPCPAAAAVFQGGPRVGSRLGEGGETVKPKAPATSRVVILPVNLPGSLATMSARLFRPVTFSVIDDVL
jgi:hypothetical protein